MKQKKSTKKYVADSTFTDSYSNQSHISELREQLRHTIEQLQQHKLSTELETQKRVIADQQCSMLKEENHELRQELEEIKKQLSKFAKKLSKIKEQRACDRCRGEEELKQKAQRERDVFMKQRAVLKNQITQLKKVISAVPEHSEAQFSTSMELLRKELEYKSRTIEDQRRVIKYLDEKLSSFELQKMQTLSYVEQVDQKLQQLQMQNLILKGNLGRENLSPSRKNGSIKNLERSRSRVSKISPTRY